MTTTADNGDRAHIKIGLVGPRGVGKTSLVTALIASGTESLHGSPVTLAPNARSAKRIHTFNDTLESSLLVEDFEAPDLKPTESLDSLEFDLTIDDDPTIGIGFDILDFPGGWIGREPKPERYEEFTRHIKQSPILLIPIDATYLMEAKEPWVRKKLYRALQRSEIRSIVVDWATRRNEQPEEPAVLVLVPVKCESYFSDNGGNRDRSRQLHKTVMDVYGDVIQQARDETTKVELDVHYCPVDTLGCVRLVKGIWAEDSDGVPQFRAQFTLQGGRPKLNRLGAGDLLGAITKYLVTTKKTLEDEDAQKAQAKAERDSERATEDRGFLGNLWWGIIGRRRELERQADKSIKEAAERLNRLELVVKALDEISEAPSEGRLKEVGDL